MSIKRLSHLGHEEAFRGFQALNRREKAKVLLLGCGALGSNLADLLAKQGYHSLTCLDFDVVEDRNFGTQAFGKMDIGRNKAVQVQTNVLRRIGVKIEAVSKKLTQDNVKILKPFDVVVDMFDNWESRELVRDYCFSNNVSCVRSGMAAMGFLGIKWATNESFKSFPEAQAEDDAPCEYPLAANLVSLCVGMTAEVVNRYVDLGEKWNAELWLANLKTEFKKAKESS